LTGGRRMRLTSLRCCQSRLQHNHGRNPLSRTQPAVQTNRASPSVKVVMRGDLKIGDKITLPPTRVVSTPAAQSGINSRLTFQGTYTIKSLRHIGNSRQADGSAWVTVIECTLDS
jgi:hypothetical protein